LYGVVLWRVSRCTRFSMLRHPKAGNVCPEGLEDSVTPVRDPPVVSAPRRVSRSRPLHQTIPLLYTTPICTFPDSSACSLVLHSFPCREVSVTPRDNLGAQALVASGGTPIALPSAAKKLLRAASSTPLKWPARICSSSVRRWLRRECAARR